MDGLIVESRRLLLGVDIVHKFKNGEIVNLVVDTGLVLAAKQSAAKF